MPLQPEPEVLNEGLYDSVALQHELIIGSNHRCPQGVWDEKLLSLFAQQQSNLYSNPIFEELGDGRGAAAPVQQGFRKSHLSAVRALRVPFIEIAGELTSHSDASVRVSPLQLICTAAAATQNYAVFGSRTLDILLQFKWHGFAKLSFIVGAFASLCQVRARSRALAHTRAVTACLLIFPTLPENCGRLSPGDLLHRLQLASQRVGRLTVSHGAVQREWSFDAPQFRGR